ncbi:kelch domain-containing protein 4-like [Glandiceps talaboti]
MGKKNKKKDKKGRGAEKTAEKTAKKAEKRARKELDEDLEALIAEFTELDRKRTDTTEEPCQAPSPRCNMTLTAHPDKDELIMFGGEYYNGKKTFVYNDLYIYNIRRNEWSLVKAPNAPPPRCAHQAVAISQGGGQLWIFGGEFSSPSQSQFHHYKDLWVWHLSEKKWEKVSSSGAPSSRSGHRMVACKRQLIIFGGFHESLRDYRYFNDVNAFNLDTYKWTKLSISGNAPSPRSGCQLVARSDGALVVYGGYTKKQLKKEVDTGVTHEDLMLLSPVKEGSKGDADAAEPAPIKWKWSRMSQSGMKPLPRSGAAMALTTTPGSRAIMFGGVFDVEDDDEDMESEFYNDIYTLDLEKGRWFEVKLRGQKKKKRRRRKKEKEVAKEQTGDGSDKDSDSDDADEAEAEAEEDKSDVATAASFVSEEVEPCGRMNTLLAVKHGILYCYGGIYEEGEKEVTLSDMYSLDIHKQNEWKLLQAMDTKQDWKGESSSGDEEEDDDDKEDEEMDDDDNDDDDDDGKPVEGDTAEGVAACS